MNLTDAQIPITNRTCSKCGVHFPAFSLEHTCSSCKKETRKQLQESRVAEIRPLSNRENQVVDLVAKGKLNKEIAWELCLTEGTIKEYLFIIFRKTKVRNRAELVAWKLRGGA